MSLMFQPFKKYADFNGRARRSEYWLFSLFCFIVGIVIGILRVATGGFESLESNRMDPIGILNLLFSLAVLVPSIVVAFRRLHDTNRSAWWILIGLIPLIGWIVLIVFYLLPGTPGPNRFGPDPKSPHAGGADAAEVFS
jgi:uncharacterized membrane protein YhaH (DUF805 family)